MWMDELIRRLQSKKKTKHGYGGRGQGRVFCHFLPCFTGTAPAFFLSFRTFGIILVTTNEQIAKNVFLFMFTSEAVSDGPSIIRMLPKKVEN